MQIKLISAITTCVLIISSFHVATALTPIRPDQSLPFYLGQDEGFGVNITTLDAGGNNYIDMNVRDAQGIQVSKNIFEGGTLAFSVNGSYPEWSGTTNGILNLTMLILGGETDFMYSKPWSMDPNTVTSDGPPAMMWPMIPNGDQFYWDTVTADMQSLGYGVGDSANEFSITFTNASISASIVFDKTTGLLKHYEYMGPINTNTGVVQFHLVLDQIWTLAPSKATTLKWYAQDLLLDYEATQANFDNGTDGIDLHVGQPSSDYSGPIWGQGKIYTGDTVHVNFNEMSDFNANTPDGYIFELSAPNGQIQFNVTLELPSNQTEKNNQYLYPLFPQTDLALVEGYFGLTKVVADQYSYNINSTNINLEYSSQNITITASWELSTGVLTHWMLYDKIMGQHVEFSLISYQSVSNFDLHWGASVGDGLTFEVTKLTINPNDQIVLDGTDASGYIADGDRLYFEVTQISDFQDGPAAIFYNLQATNGHQNNITMEQPYPGDTHSDGPPTLLPYFILGNDTLWNWATTLYKHAGATFSHTTNQITLDWSYSMQDGSTVLLNAKWRASDGALTDYSASSTFANGSTAFVLDLTLVGSGNLLTTTSGSPSPTGSGSNAPGFLPVNNYVIVFALICLPILRKYKSKKL